MRTPRREANAKRISSRPYLQRRPVSRQPLYWCCPTTMTNFRRTEFMGSTALQRSFQEYVQYAEVRHLAFNIVALQQEKMFHSLAVLSGLPGEGKTLVCAALAMAYADACRTKVLIVDTASVHNKHSLILK